MALDGVAYLIECENCHHEAEMKSPLAKYCGDSCRYEANNKRKSKEKEALF